MTGEEFIDILDRRDYWYEILGNKVVVTYRGSVSLRDLTSLPPGVEFKNWGSVDLEGLTSLPPGVVFKNRGHFTGDVDLESLTSISPGVVFENGGDVHLKALTGDWFSKWKGNIEGIDSKRLLNLMIKQGMFI
jgi:hypothetical protein